MNSIRIVSTRSIASHMFWILLLQGILAVLVGVLVIMYPEVVPVLIATMFLWTGLTTLFIAWRIRKFWREIPDIFA